MKAFQELGAEIERQWRRANYDEPALPQIATDALAAAALERHVDPWDVVRWIHTATALPAQQDVESDFGDLAKRRVLDLVGARVPDRDPVTTIVRWAGELSQTAVFGSHESNVLGIENFCDQHLQSLEQSLAGRVDSGAASYLTDLRTSPLAPLV